MFYLLLPGQRVKPVPLAAPWARLADLVALLRERPPATFPARVVRHIFGNEHHTLPQGGTSLWGMTVNEWNAWYAQVPQDVSLHEVNNAIRENPNLRCLIIQVLEES